MGDFASPQGGLIWTPCLPACEGEEEGMDEFELEDNLEFIFQSIQELMEDQGDNNAFGDANQNQLFASLVSYDQVCYPWFLPCVRFHLGTPLLLGMKF